LQAPTVSCQLADFPINLTLKPEVYGSKPRGDAEPVAELSAVLGSISKSEDVEKLAACLQRVAAVQKAKPDVCVIHVRGHMCQHDFTKIGEVLASVQFQYGDFGLPMDAQRDQHIALVGDKAKIRDVRSLSAVLNRFRAEAAGLLDGAKVAGLLRAAEGGNEVQQFRAKRAVRDAKLAAGGEPDSKKRKREEQQDASIASLRERAGEAVAGPLFLDAAAAKTQASTKVPVLQQASRVVALRCKHPKAKAEVLELTTSEVLALMGFSPGTPSVDLVSPGQQTPLIAISAPPPVAVAMVLASCRVVRN
jgi:hypothetical protein